MSNTKRAFRNVLYSTGGYAVQLILSLVVRIFFVRFLGREYLGLNSVYASLLSVISIADLGLDTVFVFLFYQPFHEKNFPVVKGILKLYKKVYRLIALLVFLIGVTVVPFIPSIIGTRVNLSGVYTIYFLYVLNAVVGYLNTYNRSLLIADQQSYIVSGVTSAFIIVVDLIQIIQLLVVPNPVVYMVIQVLGTVLTNVVITEFVKRHYAEVLNSVETSVTTNQMSTLWRNGIGGVSNKVGSVVVISSDNILLSMFTNLVVVGMYSNYTVLTAAISQIMQTISKAITPSIGQMGVESTEVENRRIFMEISFSIYSLSTFIFFFFFGLVTPFVRIWLGEKNVFPFFLTWLISFNLWLTLIRTPSWMFADSFGLQWAQKWKAPFEAIINLFLSLCFLKLFHLGIEGIILGTILSTIVVVIWYEPLSVFRHIIPSLSLTKYGKFGIPFLILVIEFSLVYWFETIIFKATLLGQIISFSISFSIATLTYCLFFFKNPLFSQLYRRICQLARRN
ncbi:lipopolysaccharide biosynthesis protein [Furfurilactobacillus curtus]|uniref:Sugar translocase n=1 Tax=Furfurilactobacillus curtus TaxID=1746200 RepID=A0ABQ5JMS1_9LACO